MLLKSADDKTLQLAQLESLLARTGLSPTQKTAIERERNSLAAGVSNEKDSAYHIDFRFGQSRNWVVLHDLRIEEKGRVAQIDHLLINRFLEFYVLESKSYSSGVQINDQGEFSIWVGRRSVGIASPIEQNQRHISVLRDLLDALPMPSRLGIRLNPSLQSYVLVSERATIKRPAERLAEYSSIIKADMLATKIDREVDEAGALKALSSVAKMVSSEAIESIGRLLVMEHKPHAVNYVAKFGLKEESIPQAVVDTVHEPAPPPLEAPVCEKCGSAMVARVAKRGENAGNEFWGCSRYPACRFVRAT